MNFYKKCIHKGFSFSQDVFQVLNFLDFYCNWSFLNNLSFNKSWSMIHESNLKFHKQILFNKLKNHKS